MVKGDDEMISFKLNSEISIYSEDEYKMGDSTVQGEDDASILVSLEIGADDHIDLSLDETMKITYCSEDSKFYEFMTEVELIRSDDRRLLIKINKPSEYQVVQRREFVRVPTMLDIQFFIIDEKISDDHKKTDELIKLYKSKEWIKGYAYDLSAGGLGAALQESIDHGKKILCFISDDDFDTGFTGKIVHACINEQDGNALYKIGVQFLGLDYDAKEKLVQYIFKKMRKQLKVR